jgi:hypothetical protein
VLSVGRLVQWLWCLDCCACKCCDVVSSKRCRKVVNRHLALIAGMSVPAGLLVTDNWVAVPSLVAHHQITHSINAISPAPHR